MAPLDLDEKIVGASSITSPVSDQGIGVVKEKYHGTDNDRHEMEVLGKQQVLRVIPPFELKHAVEVLTYRSAISLL